jgi:hypothetical protein
MHEVQDLNVDLGGNIAILTDYGPCEMVASLRLAWQSCVDAAGRRQKSERFCKHPSRVRVTARFRSKNDCGT